MPDRAMEPNRKVVIPPMTQVGVLAKKAPICTATAWSALCDESVAKKLTVCLQQVHGKTIHSGGVNARSSTNDK